MLFVSWATGAPPDAPDEIVRSLAEVVVIDELVGSGRAARL